MAFPVGKTEKKNDQGLMQARNQDFMWGGANEAKVDQTTEMNITFVEYNCLS